MHAEQILKAKILIVDDQVPNVRLLERMLQAAGYADVTGITDPREVATLYRERNFDVVLLDLTCLTWTALL